MTKSREEFVFGFQNKKTLIVGLSSQLRHLPSKSGMKMENDIKYI